MVSVHLRLGLLLCLGNYWARAGIRVSCSATTTQNCDMYLNHQI